MASAARATLTLAALAGTGTLLAWSPGSPGEPAIAAVPVAGTSAGDSAVAAAPRERAEGYPIENETVVARCERCHAVDEAGRMSRVSYMRKTPEGWQTSVRRMVALHGARLSPEHAREIVRYLSNAQGLAPEELRPGLFEVERRLVEYDYPGDSRVELTCIQCHSMGRVVTQRRTREEWSLLLATHRALYPLVDFQAFRRTGPLPTEPGPDGSPPDRRHPMDRAIDHLSEAFPLETPEWSAWAATRRSPRLAGVWALSGYEPGKGPLYGSVRVEADPSDPDAFHTTASYVYAESGERVERSGEALVYTGYQWRGRSNPDTESELREVMTLERDWRSMSGRWFTGAYDELGPDVRLARADGAPVATGVHPTALRRGGTATLRVYGAGLPAGASAAGLDFGPGVVVEGVSGAAGGGAADGGVSGADALSVRVRVAEDAPVGPRDLFAFGRALAEALVVHDGADRIEVTPSSGMARVGGAAFPKGHQVFDAIGYDDGPDGEPGTADDLALGRLPVRWALEEYTATYEDDDVAYVGRIGEDGTFVPALDGPNPERSGARNNIGDVWVVATHDAGDGRTLRARAHLLVTVPLYIRFDPWREVER